VLECRDLRFPRGDRLNQARARPRPRRRRDRCACCVRFAERAVTRMSGTSFGTVFLHVAPEGAVGGPLALVEEGDEIDVDADAGRLDLLVEPSEPPGRQAAWAAAGLAASARLARALPGPCHAGPEGVRSGLPRGPHPGRPGLRGAGGRTLIGDRRRSSRTKRGDLSIGWLESAARRTLSGHRGSGGAGTPRTLGGSHRRHVRQPGHRGVSSRSEHQPGRPGLLPRLLKFRVLPGRAHLPQPGPGALGAGRQCAGTPGPAVPARVGAVVWRCLRADAAPSRRPVLVGHHRRLRRRHRAVHR